MGHAKVELYYHITWSTFQRNAWMARGRELKRSLYRAIDREAQSAGCKVLGLDCAIDHVHLLVAAPPTKSVSDIVHQVKGATARQMNDEAFRITGFRWQQEYAAFTVSRHSVPIIMGYIERQEGHHAVRIHEIQAEGQLAQRFIVGCPAEHHVP